MVEGDALIAQQPVMVDLLVMLGLVEHQGVGFLQVTQPVMVDGVAQDIWKLSAQLLVLVVLLEGMLQQAQHLLLVACLVKGVAGVEEALAVSVVLAVLAVAVLVEVAVVQHAVHTRPVLVV